MSKDTKAILTFAGLLGAILLWKRSQKSDVPQQANVKPADMPLGADPITWSRTPLEKLPQPPTIQVKTRGGNSAIPLR